VRRLAQGAQAHAAISLTVKIEEKKVDSVFKKNQSARRMRKSGAFLNGVAEENTTPPLT